MPIYEYQCAKCGHQVEVLQKLSDEPLRQCTACGEDALTKLISETNFQLKGSGWYKAPPKDSSGQGSAPKSSAGSANKESSDLGKGATESAASSEAKGASDNKAPADKPASTSKKDE